MSAAKSQAFNAAVVEKFGQEATVKEIGLPQPGPNQALVKVLTSGICHTDLHALEGDWPVKPEPPFVPGHEGRSEEHTSELQSRFDLVCRLLLEKKNTYIHYHSIQTYLIRLE